SQGFSYDGDGNQLTAPGMTNSFDAENRLVWIAYTNGYTQLRYDGLDRLREVAEYNAVGTQTSLVRYVWNGWLPAGELDGSNRLVRTFTWGPDLSGTVGGAGGIGGLLAIRQGGTNYYCGTDGKGNVTEARWSNGAVRASYTYAPFGELLTQTNTYNQPFRFQSKLFHARSGLSYFGARWMDPSTGRWLSREPLGEAGSINLYSYCANDPVNNSDPLGLESLSRRRPFAPIDGLNPVLGGYPKGLVGGYQDWFDSQPHMEAIKQQVIREVSMAIATRGKHGDKSIPLFVSPDHNLPREGLALQLEARIGIGSGFSVHVSDITVQSDNSCFTWRGTMYISEGYGFQDGRNGTQVKRIEKWFLYPIFARLLRMYPDRGEYIASWPVTGGGDWR
ncbi:MAG: RHS repeat-associated core domain-containing protein, partial [Phycisphaerae bacterium]|nr:RHS repeat-associated core domain-containing protein [Phycisphaerae bacterium]